MNPLADAALRASIVLLTGLALRAGLRRRSPALRHAVLAAAIVAAPWRADRALAPGLPVPTGLPARARCDRRAGSSRRRRPRPDTADPGDDADHATRCCRSDPGLEYGVIALAAWAAGAAVALGWLLRRRLRVGRVAARGVIVERRSLAPALEQARHDAGLPGPVQLLVVPDGQAARDLGLVEAAGVDPRVRARLERRSRTDGARPRDCPRRAPRLAGAVVAETLRALLWWNPLAWLACRALRARQRAGL